GLAESPAQGRHRTDRGASPGVRAAHDPGARRRGRTGTEGPARRREEPRLDARLRRETGADRPREPGLDADERAPKRLETGVERDVEVARDVVDRRLQSGLKPLLDFHRPTERAWRP